MIEPYPFMRLVTMSLGLTWTGMGVLRAVHFARAWRRRLALLGFDDRWWRRQVATACLRATVLDPINLALACLLIAIWTLPGTG